MPDTIPLSYKAMNVFWNILPLLVAPVLILLLWTKASEETKAEFKRWFARVPPPLIERFSAWMPPVMSMFALVVVVHQLVGVGTTREPDEGAAAHMWQLLMAGQFPFVAWHAMRWIPRAPAPGLTICAVQIFAILAAIAPVWWFQL
jgi:hypothetical protein